jgi:uncharacterized protein YbbC (DUF1343 family)
MLPFYIFFMKQVFFILLFWATSLQACAQIATHKDVFENDIKVGAAQFDQYLSDIQNKRVAICANHTSMVGNTHLVDTLVALKINVVKVFSPEHGFRGEAEAGKHVSSTKDEKTGLPLVSLYGKTKKPSVQDMQGVDIVLFDIQDVGARFYTYISTMHYIMEAAAENNVDVIILDRPNPNGYFVDGPLLDMAHTSFVGMHPVPIVHGMTVGEYARMINGESWLANGVKCNLKVVRVFNYNHTLRYQLPIAPSPNLPNMASIYLYPSLCLFEGTTFSMGRGTDKPFQVIGHPDLKIGDYQFTPKSIPGKAANPPHLGKVCRGFDLSSMATSVLKNKNEVNLFWLIDTYNNFPDKKAFFNTFFTKLAGNTTLRQQIESGMSEAEIRKSWESDLQKFKTIRKKYLLYTDFE